MYKISIIYENEMRAQEEDYHLEELFREYENNHKVHFMIYSYNGADAYFESNDRDSDLVLIEVKEGTKLGFDTAKKIRNNKLEALIMMFSDSKRYALNGYDYGAMAYFVRPIEWEKFNICVKRAVFLLRRMMKRKIRIKCTQGFIIVPLNEILYVEVDKHILFYHLHPKSPQKQKILQARGTLQDVEEFLGRFDFARCNGSNLVNLNHVMSIMNSNVYLPEVTLSIGRNYKENFQGKVMKYLNERDVWKI